MPQIIDLPDDSSRQKLRICLILGSLLYPASLAIWFPIYFILLMGGIALPVYLALAYPVVVVVALAAGWVFYRKRRPRPAWWALALPLINILLVAGAMAALILTANLSKA